MPDRTLCVSCAEKQRLRDYARYARLKAEGKKQPRNLEKARARGRRRYHRLTAERRAKGLCLKCGKAPPLPDHRLCGPCAGKQRQHERAHYARLKAEGKSPYKDPGKARERTRRRYRRQTAERRAKGLCLKCGKAPPVPDRTLCGSCAGKQRMRERGGDVEARRRAKRARGRKRRRALREAGLCSRCGKHSPIVGRTYCEACRETRRNVKREQHDARRAAGLCVKCGEPTFGGASRCGPCAVLETRHYPKRNAAARKRYARRRAQGLCTSCGAPSQGAARCPPCARHSYLRSGEHRGLPLYPPRYTVIETATGEDHGTFDSWEEVAMCLAFARLSLDQVEVLTDQSPMATCTSW